MLRVVVGEELSGLASQLAGVLAEPPEDPMAPEWIVVPSAGVDRWLRLQLARRLGASAPPPVDPTRPDAGVATDGIAANLDLLYPGRFTRRVLAERPDERVGDPWDVEHLTWVLLQVLEQRRTDPALAPVTRAVQGATAVGRARRLADLFDRYLMHRPLMVRSWEQGRSVDSWGFELADRVAWQPHLWRAVCDHIGRPSPVQVRTDRLEAVRSGQCPAAIPERVSLFGLTSIPGGSPFIDLLDALGTQRDVHLFVPQPSLEMVRSVLGRVPGRRAAGGAVLRRSEDESSRSVAHPLLRSWARSSRETLILLGDRINAAAADPSTGADPPAAAHPTTRPTLLAKVQRDLRADRPPAATFSPDPSDRSIRIHSCHGMARQVEVLRDQLLHLLEGDASLDEDDIVVMSPALEQCAPIIESVWGPSAGERDRDLVAAGSAPALRYRITDRSLGSAVPMVAALGSLVELLDSRCSDAAVLDFIGQAPVRERYGFDDSELAMIADWVRQANVRWGLDGAHREEWGVPRVHVAGTWASAIDRLLLGVMLTDDPSSSGLDGVLPIDVEGAGVRVAGRLADLLGRLSALVEESRRPRPVSGWLELLHDAAGAIFAAPADAPWQQAQLNAVLESIGDAATIDDVACGVQVTLADLRAVLGSRLQRDAGRANFFRGGITVTSLTPLRGLPYKVVCILGLDEAAFSVPAPDGDDLIATVPAVGDLDRRAETRHAVLDAVLCAGSNLIITRTGHSVVTNQPLPPAVVVAELAETLSATLDPQVAKRAMQLISVEHPRQCYDRRNFTAGGIESTAVTEAPWSFDPIALSGAGRRAAASPAAPFLATPLVDEELRVVELEELRDFLTHPVRHFLRRRLGVQLPDPPGRDGEVKAALTQGADGVARAAVGRPLLLELDALESWSIGDELLAHLRDGRELDTFEHRMLARGSLPPGRLSAPVLATATSQCQPLVDQLEALGLIGPVPQQVPIDLTLPGGERLVGSVRDDGGHEPGPLTATYSKWSEKRVLGPWLEVLALTAQDPATPWCATMVTRPTRSTAAVHLERLQVSGATDEERRERALDALRMVIDLWRRGRREPLPLFTDTSRALHRGENAADSWTPFVGTGERDDVWNHAVTGGAELEELRDMPCRPWDPDGPGDTRVMRYAHLLWDTYDESRRDVDPEDALDPGASIR